MSANTGRAGSGRHEAQRRTAGLPATAPTRSARPGRKTVAGLAGFGSAAALAGAGMAMLASPGSVPSAAGAAHTAQPGVQKATLTASKAATPPQPNLPQGNGTDAANVAPPATPPGNLLSPAPQTNNPSVGVQLNGYLPFSTIPGVLFGTPNGSAAVKMDLPSMLFDNTAGGSGTFTATSSQAGGFVNSALGFLPIPQQQDLGPSVQNSRDSSGNLPSWVSGPLAGQSTAGANQNAADAFNALFGPGGSADYAQNITEALLPQPMVPSIDPSGVPGFLNPTSALTGSSAPATGGTSSAAPGTGLGTAGADPAALGPGAGLNLNPIGFQIPAADQIAALQESPLQGVSQNLSGLTQLAQLVPDPRSTAVIPDQTVLPGGYIPSSMGIQVIGPGGEVVTVNSAGAQVTVPPGVGPNGAEPATTFPVPIGIALESGVIQVPGNQGTPTLSPGDYKLGNPPADPNQSDNRPTLTILPQTTSNPAGPTTDGSAATAPTAPAAPASAPAAPAAPANNTDDGTGNAGVVTTVPASSQVSGPDLPSTVPAAAPTLPAPAGAGSSDLSNYGAPPSGTLYPSDTSGGYGY